MTLLRAASGVYEADFRFKGFARLHLSMGTRDADEAEERYQAVRKLFRQNRRAMIAQLTLPKHDPQRLTVVRLVQMIEDHEPLVPIAAPAPQETVASAASQWGTVREAGDRYLEWLRTHQRKAKGTHATAGAQVRRFCAFEYDGMAIGDMPLDAVTTPMIEAYQADMIDGGAAPNTITAYMIRVGALWRWVAQREDRDARQAKRSPVPVYSPVVADELYRKSTARDRFLTVAEVAQLLEATPAPLRALVALAVYAGLRRDEALYLRPKDVDLELGLISITEKRLPDGEEWTPKTKRSKRDVPIGPLLRPILEQHLADGYGSAEWLSARPHDPAWPWDPRAFQNHFTKVVETAEMIPGRTDPNGVTYHTLRHTFASHLAMQGVDLFTIAQLLGDSMATVEETYAHLSPDYKRAAMAKLASAFGYREMTQKGANDDA